MSHTTKNCPACGQALRIPEELGGVTMACPNCGQRIPSSFKLGNVNNTPLKTQGSQRASLVPPPAASALLPQATNASIAKDRENQSEAAAMPQRLHLLNASGLTRYKLMMREG